MNEYQLKGNWLVGAIQKRYGHSLEQAKKEVEAWRTDCGC